MSSTRSENSWHKRTRVMDFSCKSLIVSLARVNIVVYRHEDDAVLEMERMHHVLVDHLLLDILEELSCSASWVHPPHEHDWFPGDVKELTKRIKFDDSQNFPRSWMSLAFSTSHSTESVKTYSTVAPFFFSTVMNTIVFSNISAVPKHAMKWKEFFPSPLAFQRISGSKLQHEKNGFLQHCLGSVAPLSNRLVREAFSSSPEQRHVQYPVVDCLA